jgi:hypothetical protein
MKLTKNSIEILQGKNKFHTPHREKDYNDVINTLQCKEIGKTKKQEIEDFKNLLHDRTKKRMERIKFVEKINYKERLKERLNETKILKLEKIIKENYNINTNKGLVVLNSEEFRFKISEDVDWSYYSKGYKYPKIWRQTELFIPLKHFKLNSNYHVIDGIVNTRIFSEKQFGQITIISANCLITKKGNKIVEERKLIALKGNISYHADKIGDAKIGLERKIKRLEKGQVDKILTSESYITKNLYHKLTGACFVGINDFINQHEELKNRNRIKISELLQYNDFWGKDKLLNIVK